MRTAGPINEVAADRINADTAAALAAGFPLMNNLYASGTALYECNAFEAKRQAILDQPLAGDVFAAHATRVAAEKRIDHTVPLATTRDTGTRPATIATDAGSFGIEEQAYASLVGRVAPAGARGYLVACPSKLRALNANHWLSHPANEEVAAQLRTRINDKGARQVWAAVSTTYTAFDTDVIAIALAEIAPAGARGAVEYDGYASEFRTMNVTPIKDSRLVGTGEVFNAGTIITTADDGTASLKFTDYIERGMCRNFMILDTSTIEIASLRHVGNKAKFQEAVKKALAASGQKSRIFVDKWIEADKQEIFSGNEHAYSKIGKLVELGHVKVAGVEKSVLKNRIIEAFKTEPRNTLVGLVNAITKAAHTNRWSNPAQVRSLEEQGSQLLYVTRLPASLLN